VSPAAFAEFWAGRDLWTLPLFAGVLAAAVLSYLGVFIVLKRMVFVSAALSEISGVGVAFAFYVGALWGIDPHSHRGVPVWLDPTWFSLAFACGSAALFRCGRGTASSPPRPWSASATSWRALWCSPSSIAPASRRRRTRWGTSSSATP
jgi:hypothetical protein